jgi:hypothetical protein
VPLTDNGKNTALDALDETATGGITHAALHSGYPGTTGANNELAGGSPAYARKAVTLAAASGGTKALNGTLPTFDVPGSTTVSWLSYWDDDDAGNCKGYAPLGGGSYKPFSVDDAATDVLDAKAHGFSNGDSVVVWGSGLPTGLAVGTIYYVINAATDSLKLSATSGGSAIDLTAIGHGWLQKIVPETFNAQGTYAVSAGSLDLATLG